MRNYFFATLLTFCANIIGFAQLSGFAYLSGQSNHANIKVKFIAVSPAAISDSAFTAANGSYSINITGGVYQVVFSKPNFQNIYYNNTTALALTNTVVLSTQTLIPGNFFTVSGVTSGTWTSNSTYLVTGNLTVPQGSTLTIQPGVIVKFNGNYSLTVSGGLSAIGDAANKILFTSAQNTPQASNWYGICPANKSVIKNCVIEYAFEGIDATAGSHTIEACEFRNCVFGIYLLNSSNSLIRNNLIWSLKDSYFSCGIIIEGQSSALVECNTLHTISGVGVRAWSAVNIKNNLIYNITKPLGSSYGWGIWSDYYASGRIENNYVHHCIIGVSLGDSPNFPSNPIQPTIINNVLTDNTNGIQYTAEAYGVIANNIIANNQTGIKDAYWANSSSVLNNIFFNNTSANFSNVTVPGIGVITGTNASGMAIDSYFNLFQDPLLLSGTPFYAPGSPCINSGKTLYSANIGMNANALCQGMIMGIKSEANSGSNIQVFPNPFKEQLVIRNANTNEISNLSIFDLSGRAIHFDYIMAASEEIKLDLKDLPSGFYFLSITYTNTSKAYLRLLKE